MVHRFFSSIAQYIVQFSDVVQFFIFFYFMLSFIIWIVYMPNQRRCSVDFRFDALVQDFFHCWFQLLTTESVIIQMRIWCGNDCVCAMLFWQNTILLQAIQLLGCAYHRDYDVNGYVMLYDSNGNREENSNRWIRCEWMKIPSQKVQENISLKQQSIRVCTTRFDVSVVCSMCVLGDVIGAFCDDQFVLLFLRRCYRRRRCYCCSRRTVFFIWK